MKNICLLLFTVLLYSSKGIAQTPNWEWKKHYNDAYDIKKLVADADKNILIQADIWQRDWHIENLTFSPANGTYLLLKYNSNGQLLYHKQYSKIGQPFISKGFVSDQYNNIYTSITSIEDNVNVGNIYLASQGNYIVKFSATGDALWAYATNGIAQQISIDKYNNLWLTGAHTVSNTHSYNTGKLLIQKINTVNGQLEWEYRNSDENITSHGLAIANDSIGNTFIYGRRNGAIEWDNTTISYNNDINFIIKLNTNQELEWYKTIGVTESNPDYGIQFSFTADQKGGCYLMNFSKDYVSVDGITKDNIDNSKKALYLYRWGNDGTETTFNRITQINTLPVHEGTLDQLKHRDGILYYSLLICDSVQLGNEIISVNQNNHFTTKSAFVMVAADSTGNTLWYKVTYADIDCNSGKYLDFDVNDDAVYIMSYGSRNIAYDDGDNFTNTGNPNTVFFAKLSHTSSVPDINDPILSKNELLVYPNPTHNTIHLQWKANTAYERLVIRDILGREVQLEKINTKQNSLSLSLGHLPKGVYTVEVSNTTHKQRTKIVLQ